MTRGRTRKPKQPPKKRGPKREVPKGLGEAEMVSTGVNLPLEIYQVLKVVALKRQRDPAYKGRATISAILTDLAARHLAELKAEAGEHLKLAELL